MNKQEMLSEIKRLQDQVNDLQDQVNDLQDQVNDLQSGMYINCVYCGHRYGPRESTPVSMADVLKEHVEQCPKHPMSALKDKLKRIDERIDAEVKKSIESDREISDTMAIHKINDILKEK